MYLDELIDYPSKVLNLIGHDRFILQLLTNDPSIDPDSEEADTAIDKFLHDYGYVDSTTVESAAYICVETEVSKANLSTMQDMRLYVTIFCHKNFMDIDSKKFRGVYGNRRDNLIRAVDDLLNGSMAFGLGKLDLVSANIIPCPTGFSARELVYFVPDIKKARMPII